MSVWPKQLPEGKIDLSLKLQRQKLLMKFNKFNDVSRMIIEILPQVELVYGEQSVKRNQMLLQLSKAYKELGQHKEACSAAQSIIDSILKSDSTLTAAQNPLNV
jgi:hypothetical protein